MLYASLFAAIGSAVENEGDTQQLQLPLTIPLLVAFFIALYAFKAPDSGLVFWGSIIPFTSPIVMLARLPFGVPVWEIVLSVVLLIAAFALFAWISAKIYKVASCCSARSQLGKIYGNGSSKSDVRSSARPARMFVRARDELDEI